MGSRELDAACAVLVRELDVDGHGMLSLQGLNATIKRFHDTMADTKTRVHEVTCRWSELRRAAMEAQRTIGKDATAGQGAGAADEEAVQRVRREAQRQAEAKAQQEAALELERKARRERDKKAMEERDRGRHAVQTAPAPAPAAAGSGSK